jgi:hypothetical protein
MDGFPGESNFIGIPAADRNKPVYRVVSFRRLIELLVTRSLVPVRPGRWEDPFENWLLRERFETQAGTRIGFGMRDRLYGQCWTWNEESADGGEDSNRCLGEFTLPKP